MNSPWQLSTASILHNNVEKPTKPLHSPLVAQIGGFPAMARDTCMVCHQRFQARNELFDHLEKKGHTVDPVSSLIVHFMRHGNCLQGVKKLKRQHRRSERLKEQNQQREERTREYGIARQWLLDKIQNCNSQPQRDFTESTLWRLEQQKEEDHRKYVETETLRMAKGRSTCKCELCGRTCHNMWKLMRHKCLEHGMEFRDAEDTTIMRLSWRCGRLSLDGQGCHLHSA